MSENPKIKTKTITVTASYDTEPAGEIQLYKDAVQVTYDKGKRVMTIIEERKGVLTLHLDFPISKKDAKLRSTSVRTVKGRRHLAIGFRPETLNAITAGYNAYVESKGTTMTFTHDGSMPKDTEDGDKK